MYPYMKAHFLSHVFSDESPLRLNILYVYRLFYLLSNFHKLILAWFLPFYKNRVLVVDSLDAMIASSMYLDNTIRLNVRVACPAVSKNNTFTINMLLNKISQLFFSACLDYVKSHLLCI